MNRVARVLRFVTIMFIVFFLLLIMDVIILAGVDIKTKNGLVNVNVEKIAQLLEEENGTYFLSDEGKQRIDWCNGFAILIDEQGEVIWEYKMPKDIPTTYSRADIASFSRWYLKDYPVSTWVVNQNIFVLGQPKKTVWKYGISYAMNTMETYIFLFPILLLSNVILLIAIPTHLSRKISRKKEMQRTEWIAGVSHDIRTPLSLVLGNASAIREKSEDEYTIEKADSIEKHALRMRTLIANLNMDNKLSYGLGKWNKDEINFAALVRDVVCDVMNQEENDIYEFDLEIAESAEKFITIADKDLVRRLVENIIWNAVRHNPKGCMIRVSLLMRKHRCLFSVSDDGTGVTEEQLKLLNQRPGEDTLPEHGLGIRLVKHIAEQYHWKVRFYHANPKGLSCEVKLR